MEIHGRVIAVRLAETTGLTISDNVVATVEYFKFASQQHIELEFTKNSVSIGDKVKITYEVVE